MITIYSERAEHIRDILTYQPVWLTSDEKKDFLKNRVKILNQNSKN